MNTNSTALADKAKGLDAKKIGNALLNNALIIIMLAVAVYVAVTEPSFLAPRSLVNLLSLTAAYLPVALGIAGCIVLTGTDLSAGRAVGITACVAASLLQAADAPNKMWPAIGTLPVPLVILIVVALGAAIGAKVGNPEKTVIHVTGDGSFRMNCNELATEQYYNLPIITFIYNNQTLGMVRQWQTLIYNGHYSQTTLDRGPDFVKLAEAYGLKGFRAGTQAEFEEAFRQALQAGCGCVIDCAIRMDAMVHPMVSAGTPVTDFILD